MTAAESAACRAAVLAIGDWIVDEQSPMPTRAEIAAAVIALEIGRAAIFRERVGKFSPEDAVDEFKKFTSFG